MIKFLFKRLLLANYSFSKRWVNKKLPKNIIPATLWTFLSTLSFIIAGLSCVIIGLIPYKIKYPEFLLIVIVLIFGYGMQKETKRTIYKWNIETEYKTLTKNQRLNRNRVTFIFFWGSFALFFYLGVIFLGN